MGNEQPNTEPGDVVFVLQQKDHAVFKRKGADLLIQKDVASRGGFVWLRVRGQTLDGRSLVKSKPGQIVRPEVSAGVPYVLCVDGEGMPKAGNPFDKGRLFVLFTIVFPPNYSLGDEQAALLKQALPPALNMDTYDANEVEEAMLEEIDLDELGKGQGAPVVIAGRRTVTRGARPVRASRAFGPPPRFLAPKPRVPSSFFDAARVPGRVCF